ncbi:LacI family DNA-binding transcriptional regulator [Vulcanisaeta sp. JCM 16159]|uniref:LacI family DNA-binding transcriptional regulator n=1 Tax=Vulcanisaeta sp. JCM 16159 TaxID=1295371 RepID=UPI000A701CA7|nr:LacI family DNA-binding transcriptional regulator [Vulcanisaeta sp. JCM 16159]
MTMKDISEKTGFSLSTVSQSLNNLVRYYMVKPEKRGRVRVFTAVPMFYELFLNQPVEMLDKEVIPLKQRLLELRGKMPELRDRIDLILSNLSNMECVLNEIIRIKNNNICVNNRKA